MDVNFGDVHQRIDGFGAADVWDAALTDAQADLFFSQTNGIGLSILRQGISTSGGSLSKSSNAVKAAARGAIVWAAPWSAPGAWKTNGTTTNGGNLLPADYSAWATSLATYASNMQAAGVPLYAVSVQNEPDYVASYDSMIYSPAQMTSFINVLGPKLAALNPRPKLIMPEVSSWGNAWSFESAVLADPTAPSYLDIVGVHQYAGFTAPQSTARPIWETEQSSFEAFDPSILNGIGVARWIHDALVTGGVSAWHYWWLIGLNSDDEGLIGYSGNTTITKRLYTVGNFSKFVRPGFVMVGVAGAPANVSVSAFKNPSTGDFVVVGINQNGSDVPVTLVLNGASAASVTPWITSSTLNLAAQTNLAISGGSFTTTLPAYSVTSFVSSGASAPAGDTTSPSVPAGLSAAATSSSQINLSWTASTDNVGVSGYHVYRGGALIGTTSAVSYSDTGLTPSTTYTYAVSAFDAAGNVSAQSGTAAATTLAQLPGMPAAANPANGATGVSTTPTLTWSASGATGYDVAFGTANPPAPVSSNQSAASYTPGTLAANTTYYWQITARNASGTTAGPVWTFTTGASSASGPPAVPNTPTPGAGATAVSTAPTLSWTSSGATGYYVGFGQTNPPGQVSANQSAASYTPGTLKSNATYYWQIYAVNGQGSTGGPVWSFTTGSGTQSPPSAPGTPAPATGATGIGTSPTLTWSATGASNYDVAFGTTNPPKAVSSNQTAASYAPGTLASNTTYFWQITARNAGGTTAGAVWSFTTAAGSPPGTPSTPAPAAGATGVGTTPTLTWSDNGATGYDVAFGTANPPSPVSSNQAGASYSPGTLGSNTTYFWQITARNGNGTTASPVWSFTTASAAPAGPPATPGSPTPAGGATSVSNTPTLTWSSAGATGYYVGFGTTNPPGQVSANQSASSYTPGTLANNTTYYWQIYAVNGSGSTGGPVWSFTTGSTAQNAATQPPPPPPGTPPGTPTAQSPASNATGVSTTPTLTWSSGGATGYYVGFGTTNPPGQVSVNQSASSYTPGTLAGNTTYYWQIYAVNGSGSTGGPVWSFTTGASPLASLVGEPAIVTSPLGHDAAVDAPAAARKRDATERQQQR